MTQERSSKEKSIYVKVSDETREIIDKHKEQGKLTISQIIADAIKLYDQYKSMAPEVRATISNYKDEYGGIAMNFIAKAIKVFVENQEPGMDKLWIRAREEMQMMLIGKTTFLQLIAAAAAPEERLDKPQKKNVGFDIILWYTGKPIKSLALEEIMDAVKIIWVMANYFTNIEIIKENGDQYHMIFKHNLQKKRYSEYWGEYFIELLTSDELSFKCVVEPQYFAESISLLIKQGYKKK